MFLIVFNPSPCVNGIFPASHFPGLAVSFRDGNSDAVRILQFEQSGSRTFPERRDRTRRPVGRRKDHAGLWRRFRRPHGSPRGPDSRKRGGSDRRNPGVPSPGGTRPRGGARRIRPDPRPLPPRGKPAHGIAQEPWSRGGRRFRRPGRGHPVAPPGPGRRHPPPFPVVGPISPIPYSRVFSPDRDSSRLTTDEQHTTRKVASARPTGVAVLAAPGGPPPERHSQNS